jgi:hypothetical protein
MNTWTFIPGAGVAGNWIEQIMDDGGSTAGQPDQPR